jgi:hypothetical protein
VKVLDSRKFKDKAKAPLKKAKGASTVKSTTEYRMQWKGYSEVATTSADDPTMPTMNPTT